MALAPVAVVVVAMIFATEVRKHESIIKDGPYMWHSPNAREP